MHLKVVLFNDNSLQTLFKRKKLPQKFQSQIKLTKQRKAANLAHFRYFDKEFNRTQTKVLNTKCFNQLQIQSSVTRITFHLIKL